MAAALADQARRMVARRTAQFSPSSDAALNLMLLEPMKANVLRIAPAMPRFALAEFGDDAVLIGALSLAAEATGWPADALRFEEMI